MSDWLEYVSEIIENTHPTFHGLRKYIRELAKTLLKEGIYIDKIWFSLTRMEYVCLHVMGYDDDDDLQIVARWNRMYDDLSNPYRKQYELVDVEVSVGKMGT